MRKEWDFWLGPKENKMHLCSLCKRTGRGPDASCESSDDSQADTGASSPTQDAAGTAINIYLTVYSSGER